MGVEAYHPSANARAARVIDTIARQETLLVTGGSDYHGSNKKGISLGQMNMENTLIGNIPLL